jgi:two-component system cell cycle sensor histidine kinase/response regulator CckA
VSKRPGGSGGVVLNVDDNDERLHYRTAVLEDAGFDVIEARTGSQALTLASNAQPSLVLLDVMLPDVDGFDVCRRLKADPATWEIPVLHVSATCQDEGHWVEGLRVGSDGYLREPVGPDVLCEVIRTVLRRVESEAAARQARHQAEEALRASERRYRGIVENAPYGICHTTVDGRFLAVNDALARMLGYESAAALMSAGSVLPFYFNPDDRSRVTARIQGDHLVGPHEIDWKRRDHVRIRVRISARRIEEGFEAFIEDATERHRLEDQLRQAHKLEAIGRLAGGVAHDFNNALTIILGFADMIAMQISPDKPMGRDLAEIRRAAEHAAGLTHQLLAFSRQQPLDLTVLDLNHLVRDASTMVRRLIGETIRVRAVLARDVCPLKADQAQLQQVVVNLAVNARDAMPDGGTLVIETGMVTVAEHSVTGLQPLEPGRYARLSVCDTGVGMDDATTRQIFEPFFTTKEVGKGTGLGLATVYGIVKQLGGSIFVESVVNGGTRFDLYFPEAPGAPDALPVNRTVEVPSAAATVLVVEDEPGVRGLTTTALTRHGYRVVEAEGSREALMLPDNVIDSVELLLTDVVMPYMSGRALAKALRQRRPGLRVLYMSGYAGEGAVRDGSMLRKPFATPALLAAVGKSLEGSP